MFTITRHDSVKREVETVGTAETEEKAEYIAFAAAFVQAYELMLDYENGGKGPAYEHGDLRSALKELKGARTDPQVQRHVLSRLNRTFTRYKRPTYGVRDIQAGIDALLSNAEPDKVPP